MFSILGINLSRYLTNIISCRGDHTEVTEIDYDPMAINFEKLLKLFWENHEYGYTTSIKRQVSLYIYYICCNIYLEPSI